jgi:YVTN family beta-propeller protein
VYVLDGELDVVGRFDVGDHPSDIAVNPDTNTVYVVNHFSDSVSVVDGSTGRVVREVPVGVGPSGMALDIDRGLVHVANYYSRSVSIFSEAQAQGPESDFVVSMDRGWAYSGGSASVSAYRLVRDDVGLSIGFNATQAEDWAFVSYTKDLSGQNLVVADAPYLSVEFTEIDESGAGRPQFAISFTDGTSVQIDDATTVRIGNRYHLTENLKEFGDKTVASMTLSASSEASAPLTSYQVNFVDVRFAERP